LEDGLAILRYGAMAMLLNSPVYFQRGLLDCLPERVMAYELEAVEQQLLQFLQVQLSKRIAVAQMSCIQPYFEQVQRALTMGRITELAVA
jgi:hypothetical protein